MVPQQPTYVQNAFCLGPHEEAIIAYSPYGTAGGCPSTAFQPAFISEAKPLRYSRG